MTANIERTTVIELKSAHNFDELLREYADECAMEGLPPPSAKMDSYDKLEKIGILHPYRATHEGILIGFITVLIPTLPHYGICVAVSESFFVTKAQRRTGAGMKLLQCAEDITVELKSPGLLVSAPHGSVLEQVLPRSGYRQASSVFFKGFKYE